MGWERQRYRGEREGDTGEKERERQGRKRERERGEKEKNYKHKKIHGIQKISFKTARNWRRNSLDKCQQSALSIWYLSFKSMYT